MNDTLYQFIVGVLDLLVWGGKLVGEENLPRRGPAVFVANHLEATGPIAACCSVPLRLYSWIIGDMIDKDLAPEWLRWDFVERTLRIKPPLSRWVARGLAKLTVPFLRSLGTVPVYHGAYERLQESLRLSMDVLRQGKFLLVFPEDNQMVMDPVTKMRAFQRSFVRLGEMYYEETGERLEFYPLAVHGSGIVEVGKVILHNPLNPAGLERHRLKVLIEDSVKAMYLQMEDRQEYLGALTPQHK
jgi:hypothetical protein